MIPFFYFFAIVVARKEAFELGAMISKSLMDSVPASRPSMGLIRRGRAYHPWNQDDEVCHLNKIRHRMETVVGDMVCGSEMTRLFLTEKICGRGKPSCFHCHTDFVKFRGHRHIEVANCIPPVINHFDPETVSHMCHATIRTNSLGFCKYSLTSSYGGLQFSYQSSANEQEVNQYKYEHCKAKLVRQENPSIDCLPNEFKSREFELTIETNSGKIERISIPIAVPKRCCANF